MTLSRQQLCQRLLREVEPGACRWVLGPLQTELGDEPASRGRSGRDHQPAAVDELPETAIVEAVQISERGDAVLAATEAQAGERSEVGAALARARRIWAVVAPYGADGRILHGSASCFVSECNAPNVVRGVSRIFSPWAVLDVTADGFVIRELAPQLSARQLQGLVEPTLKIPPEVAEIATEMLVKRA